MKVVITGSASLQNEIQKWVQYWNNQKDCLVLNYPKVIPSDEMDSLYPEIYKKFFKDISEADILFIANEEKNSVKGYIGAGAFAELNFGLAKKLVEGKNIKLILAHLPSEEVICYKEIMLWYKLSWINIL